MKFNFKRIFLCVLSLFFISASLVSADFNVSKIASETSVDDVYRISFSIPAQSQVPEPIDVVFVLDRTTTTNTFTAAKNAVQQLKNLNNVVVNVAVLQFGHNVTDMMSGFVELNDANISRINTALTRGSQASADAIGSNVYGGILLGKNLLQSRTTPRENQHLVVATDFANNRFDIGDGVGLSQFYSNNAGAGNPTCQFGCSVDYAINNDFDVKYRSLYIANPTTFHSINKIDRLINDRILFNDSGISVAAQPYFDQISSNIGLYSVPTAFSSIARRVLTAEELQFTMPVSIRTSLDSATQLEKFFYHNYYMLRDLKDTGVHITALTEPYNLGNDNWQQNLMKPINLYQQYLEDEEILRRYDIMTSSELQGFTRDIVNDISYSMAKGQLVDIIAPEFDYVMNTEALTLNGTNLVKQVISDQHFGYNIDPSRIGAPFDFEYKYEVISTQEQITTLINVPLGVDDLLSVSFDERLVVYPDSAGVTAINTNTSAILSYINSKDLSLGITDYNRTKSIPSPTINVEMGQLNIHYKDENDNTIKNTDSKLYKVGTQYNILIPDIAGYEYNDLGIGSDPIVGTVTTQEKNITLLYRLPKSSITINFESNGGSKVDNQTILKGEKVQKPLNPIKMDHRFINWYTDAKLTNVFDFSSSVTNDMILYAKWEPISNASTDRGDKDQESLPTTGIQSNTVLPLVFVLFGVTLILRRKKVN